MNDDRKKDSRKKGGRKDFSRPISPARGEIGERQGKTERIAKRLARAGVSSRREAEEMVAAGRVTVNGKVLASPAFNVGPDDTILIDGAPIPAAERTRLFLFHKPTGVVTTNRDPEGRRTVFETLPEGLPRLMTVGRLDINTEGLLLLTNDGGLARVLELPSTGWLRRYRVRVHGKVEAAALEGLKEGIAVDGVFYGAIEASLDREQGSNAWLTIGLREGKNREVKNVLGALGLDVTRLIRVSYGPFQLGDLAEGEIRELKGRSLRDQLGERLIAEAGADFDAPVTTPFSNKPVRQERRDAPGDRKRPAEREPIGEGGLIKNRKRQRERLREDALGRLSTAKPAREGGKARDFKQRKDRDFAQGRDAAAGREPRRNDPPRSRTSNVWMAPGARPTGKKKARAEFSPLEGEMAAKRPEEVGKGRAPAKRKTEKAAASTGRFSAGENRNAPGPRTSSSPRGEGARPPRGKRPPARKGGGGENPRGRKPGPGKGPRQR